MKIRPRYKKKISNAIPRDKKENIGVFTGLLDMNKENIYSGDYVQLISNSYYKGPVMWNRYQKKWGIFMGVKKYSDPLDPNNYGKFIAIPLDNGMRMDLLKIS